MATLHLPKSDDARFVERRETPGKQQPIEVQVKVRDLSVPAV